MLEKAKGEREHVFKKAERHWRIEAHLQINQQCGTQITGHHQCQDDQDHAQAKDSHHIGNVERQDIIHQHGGEDGQRQPEHLQEQGGPKDLDKEARIV